MKLNWQSLRNLALAALLAAGCDPAPPGGGITNGIPGPLRSEEKPAMRNDLPTPDMSTGDASLAAPAAESAIATDANPNQAVVPPPASNASPAPKSSPTAKEIPAGAEARPSPRRRSSRGPPGVLSDEPDSSTAPPERRL